MTGKVRRVDWSPSEWLAGTRGIGMDETAVYITVLNIIYDRGGACPNDPEFIGNQMVRGGQPNRNTGAAVSRRTGAALARLVALGKLRLSNDAQWLTNGRADAELGKANGRIDSASRAGVASGAARRDARSTHGRRTVDAPSTVSETRQVKDLARTVVRNHQPPKNQTLTSNHTEAARDPSPSQALRLARTLAGNEKPAPKIKPLDPRLAEAAAKARAKLLGKP